MKIRFVKSQSKFYFAKEKTGAEELIFPRVYAILQEKGKGGRICSIVPLWEAAWREFPPR